MSFTLLSSPLQGFTDFRFRNAVDRYFGGIDTYYAPYIRFNGKLEIKSSYQRDLLPKNNTVQELIPQVMTNDADEFLFAAKYVQELGYKELNWNLGCPYPMVVNRCMGSGLLSDTEKIKHILTRVHNESDILVSMKMRLGYNDCSETLALLPVLDQFPLKNIAIHARLGKQLYKGGVDLDAFSACLDKTKHKLYYNGDITSVEGFRDMQSRFPSIDHWMIGRGLIADPFLPQMIRENTTTYPKNKIEVFGKFHDTLYAAYASYLSGTSHTLLKMYHFWEYFINTFPDGQKGLKKIKKAKSLEAYEDGVKYVFDSE